MDIQLPGSNRGSLELDSNLRSLISPAAKLYIENGTERTVDIYWIDYNSKLIRLATLQPSKGTPINTYALHPWIFIDRATGQLMHVKNQPVLFGKPGKIEKVSVHFPMKSLQDIALLCLLGSLKDVNVVEQLEIPQILKRELRKVFLVCDEHKDRLLERPER